MNVDTSKSLAGPSTLDELEAALGPSKDREQPWPDGLSILVRCGVLRALVSRMRELEAIAAGGEDEGVSLTRSPDGSFRAVVWRRGNILAIGRDFRTRTGALDWGARLLTDPDTERAVPQSILT